MCKRNLGSNFDTFLSDDSLLEDTVATAVMRVIAWRLAVEMKAQHLTKQPMAKKMHTSRVALNLLLAETVR